MDQSNLLINIIEFNDKSGPRTRICTSIRKNDFIKFAQFWVLWSDWPHPFLTKPTQKIFDQLLTFVIIYHHAQNQFIPSVHSSDTVNFRVPSPDWSHPFLTMLTPKILNTLLICVRLYQYLKIQLVTSVLSWDTVNFGVQRPDWPFSQLLGAKTVFSKNLGGTTW